MRVRVKDVFKAVTKRDAIERERVWIHHPDNRKDGPAYLLGRAFREQLDDMIIRMIQGDKSGDTEIHVGQF